MHKNNYALAEKAQLEKDTENPMYVPPEFIGNPIEPNFFCRGWNSKREKYCRARAGQGTDHPGVGRCRIHGGMSAITHGRYSSVPRGTVAEHQDQFELESEAEKLDILPEATLMRALAANYLENYENFFQGVIRFNQMESEEAAIEKRKPMFMRPPTLEEAALLLEKAANVVDKVHKQRNASAISLKDFMRLMGLMADIVVSNVKSVERKLKLDARGCEITAQMLQDISDEWKALRVNKL